MLWGIFSRFSTFAHGARVIFHRFLFIVTDKLRVSADKATIENSARQVTIIVVLDRFEIAHRDSRLLRYFAQSNSARLACESQFFSDALRHFDFEATLTALTMREPNNSLAHLELPARSGKRCESCWMARTITLARKRCQTFIIYCFTVLILNPRGGSLRRNLICFLTSTILKSED